MFLLSDIDTSENFFHYTKTGLKSKVVWEKLILFKMHAFKPSVVVVTVLVFLFGLMTRPDW